jgi:hypothetical protein
MDNGCISDPLPSNGNLGEASFSDIVQNVSCSPPFNRFLIQEALVLTILVVKDVVV